MAASGGAQDRGLDVCGRHLWHSGQEGPLVVVGLQVTVDEDAAAAFTGRLLQRQGDQVAEASDAGTARPRLAGGHRVLIRKQAVVGAELQLAGACAGVADEGGTQPASIACRHAGGEEDPRVCPIAGAGDFKRDRHAQRIARAGEGARILSPLGIIEVHRQKVAGVIREQRINPHGVPAGEVVEDRLARDRDQRAVLAVAALDPRLFADAGAPLVRAGW